ncbi:hypothetical protein YM18_1510 [Geobacter sulfurreducens]|nr:hypothetical protein YM18_1510 [Geobacter sulfurreducens]
MPYPSQDQLIKYKEWMEFERFENAVFTDLFVTQLWIMDTIGRIPSCYVMDEIKFLESKGKKTSTKPATRFTKPPLEGLWHKHFFVSYFLVTNLCNYLGIEQGHQRNLKKIIEEVINNSESEHFTEEMSAQIAHRVSIEAFQERAGADRLTGEWIIFGKHDGKNYYLSVASHDEGDAVIFNRIQQYCVPQFPFLFSEN